MTSSRRQSRMLSASISDLHHKLGKTLAQGQPKLHAGEHAYNPDKRLFEGLALECSVRACQPIDLLETAASINAEWIETERLLDAAWKRFRASMQGELGKAEIAARKAAYKAECAAIRGDGA